MRPALLALAAASLAAAAGGSAADPSAVSAATITSSNWGGYAVHRSGARFRRVSGTWVVGRGSCTRGRAGYSATWIGLGGFDANSQALEQIGTELDCSTAGRASYSAWYELVPQVSRSIRMTVRPGDTIAAQVDVSGTRVSLRLRNRRSGASFTRTTRMSAPDVSSAEWIVEAPSACDSAARCVQLPLSNFGTTTFRRASATSVGGHTGAISDRGWSTTRLLLTSGSSAFADVSSAGAVPSGLSAAGSAFSVSYGSQAVSAGSGPRRVFPGAARPPGPA